jgi:transcriptional regulator with XRE-family HTH domain
MTKIICMRGVREIFGENLLRLIFRAGYKTQREFALEHGIDTSQLNSIIKGRAYVSEALMIKLSEYLSAEYWEFFMRDDTPVVRDADEGELLANYRKAVQKGVQGMIKNFMGFVLAGGMEGYAGQKEGADIPQERAKAG